MVVIDAHSQVYSRTASAHWATDGLFKSQAAFGRSIFDRTSRASASETGSRKLLERLRFKNLTNALAGHTRFFADTPQGYDRLCRRCRSASAGCVCCPRGQISKGFANDILREALAWRAAACRIDSVRRFDQIPQGWRRHLHRPERRARSALAPSRVPVRCGQRESPSGQRSRPAWGTVLPSGKAGDARAPPCAALCVGHYAPECGSCSA